MRDNSPKMLRDAAKKWREKHKLVGVGEMRYDFALEEAADAIEELSNAQERRIEQERNALLKSIPRWISVEEALPEAECGDFSKNVLVTDGKCIAISSYFTCEGMEPYWCYTGIGEITHWMPLPQPPKEET